MDAGRFKRLHESAGQADRDAVAMPLLLPGAGAEAQEIGLGQDFPGNVAEQPLERRIPLQTATAIDNPVADSVLQRNPPLPTGVVRHGARIGHRRPNAFGLQCNRRIARYQ